MKRIAAVLFAMLFAVNAHATRAIEFGTVTAYNDSVWAVQILVSGLPDTCDLVGGNPNYPENTSLVFGGTLRPAYSDPSANVVAGDYWPSTTGGVGVFDNVYWWAIQSDQVNCQGGDGAGWAGSLLVKGEGSIQIVNSAWYGCDSNHGYAVSNTLPLAIGGEECGWCGFATAATAPEDKKSVTVSKRSTWGSIKALYR